MTLLPYAGPTDRRDRLSWAPPVGRLHVAPPPRPAGRGGWAGSGRLEMWDLGACLALVGVAVFHFSLLRRGGEPSGYDFGNWLTIGHHWLGSGAPHGSISIYPPLVPVLTVAVVSLLGVPDGTALLAAAAGLAPAVAVYALLRRRVVPGAAVGLAAVVAAAGSTGEAVAWGGLPQLLGLGVGLVAIQRLAVLLQRPTPRRARRFGLLLLTVGLTSHLLFAQVVACAGVLTVLHLTVVRRGLTLRGPWWGRGGVLALAGRITLTSLPLVPLYLVLSRSVGASFVARSHSTALGAALGGITDVFREAPLPWRVATGMALAAPLVGLRHRRDPLWLTATTIVVTVLIVTVATGEARLAYLLPPGVVCAMALYVDDVWQLLTAWPRVLQGALALCLALVVGLVFVKGLSAFSGQRAFYGDRLVPRGTVQALRWLRTSTPPGSLVAVAPVDGLPFGWWVEGLGRRATWTGSSELVLNFPDERRRAQSSIALFSSVHEIPADYLRQLRRTPVDYLYVPAAWSGAPGSSVNTLIQQRPDLVSYRGPGAIVIEVPHA